MTHPKLAALAVVLRGSDVLLVRRRNEPDAGLWGYPGGHVEFGEKVAAAARREVWEETGIRVEPDATLLGLDAIVTDQDGAPTFHHYLVAIACAYVSGEPTPKDDVSEAKWVSQTDVLQKRLPLSRDVDTVLTHALSHQSKGYTP